MLNAGGATWRSPDTGGEPERRLAEEYEGWSTVLAISAPRTARLLRHLASRYRSDARREDDERDLNEFER